MDIDNMHKHQGRIDALCKLGMVSTIRRSAAPAINATIGKGVNRYISPHMQKRIIETAMAGGAGAATGALSDSEHAGQGALLGALGGAGARLGAGAIPGMGTMGKIPGIAVGAAGGALASGAGRMLRPNDQG